MAMDLEAKRAAMQAEEAALLPALQRPAQGKPALKSAVQKALAMRDKKIGNTVSIGEAVLNAPAQQAFSSRRSSRAALHHVLK